MTVENEGTTSLRDQLEANLDAVEETPVVEAVETAPPEGETAEQKAERLRDEKGRFVAGESGKPAEGAKLEPKQPEQVQTQEPKARPARPSSWKKEYWDHWEKLDPALADYLHQREQEYAKGVSTYKTEWDNAKPLMDAVAPFLPELQQRNIPPAQWIQTLGTAHRTLALGAPQDKLAMFQQLARDYGIPAQLAVQDGQGNWQLLAQPQRQYQQQQQTPDVRKLVQEMFQEQFTQQEIQRFAANTEKYPHYEQVRGTMAGLLQSGLAENLEDAYDAALRHPKHSDIYDAMQKQQRDADEKRQREEAARKAKEAKANAVSVRTSTPSGAAGQKEAKGLRAQLENAFDSTVTGRV
jgi:ribosomal protein L9